MNPYRRCDFSAVVGVSVFLLLAGCRQPAMRPLGPIIRTNIPPGIYVGEIKLEVTDVTNAEFDTPQVRSEPYNEIVDANGLPLIQSEGVPPRANLRITHKRATETETLTVTSVTVSGNRLLVYYQSVRTAPRREQGDRQSGEQTDNGYWLYEFIPPSTLRVVQWCDTVAHLSDGSLVQLRCAATATLEQ